MSNEIKEKIFDHCDLEKGINKTLSVHKTPQKALLTQKRFKNNIFSVFTTPVYFLQMTSWSVITLTYPEWYWMTNSLFSSKWLSLQNVSNGREKCNEVHRADIWCRSWYKCHMYKNTRLAFLTYLLIHRMFVVHWASLPIIVESMALVPPNTPPHITSSHSSSYSPLLLISCLVSLIRKITLHKTSTTWHFSPSILKVQARSLQKCLSKYPW